MLAVNGHARFARQQTTQVPIDRVFTNLQQRLALDTNSYELTYYLARLHSMAYSTNLTTIPVITNNQAPQFAWPGMDSGVPETVQVFKDPATRQQARQHLTNAITYYNRAIVLLKASTNLVDRSWLVLPLELGLAWCFEQAGQTNDALKGYRRALKYAWKKEVTGDFDFKQWTKDVWNDVRSRQNPLRPHNRGYIGPGVCYSQEIIGYLLKLLDPVKDADEIAQLKSDQKTLLTMGRAITPIFIPLTAGRFSDFVNPKAKVAFDLDGSGLKRKWGWITPKAGWLVYDSDGQGKITSALQMFGNVTFWIFWPNGYEALSSLDDNHDGVLSGDELRNLAIWTDRNSNGISEPGEVVPLRVLGIKSLSCTSEEGQNGMRWNPAGVSFTNGESRASYDWVAPSRPSR